MNWFKTNWQKTAILISSVALVMLAGVQAWDTYSTHCPPCPTPTPHPYDKPVAVPASAIVLPTVDWNP